MLPHWSLVCPLSSLVTVSYLNRPLSYLEEPYSTLHCLARHFLLIHFSNHQSITFQCVFYIMQSICM